MIVVKRFIIPYTPQRCEKISNLHKPLSFSLRSEVNIILYSLFNDLWICFNSPREKKTYGTFTKKTNGDELFESIFHSQQREVRESERKCHYCLCRFSIYFAISCRWKKNATDNHLPIKNTNIISKCLFSTTVNKERFSILYVDGFWIVYGCITMEENPIKNLAENIQWNHCCVNARMTRKMPKVNN